MAKDNMTGAAASLLLVLVLLNGWMFLQQPAMIFYPYRELDATPTDWGLPYEDVTLSTADGIALHGWYIPRAGASRTLLFFHGNAGNISHRGDSVAIFHRLGMNVFIFDYRGYGRSQGEPSERGLNEDGAAAWRHLTETRDVDPGQIVLFGRSLGGAVAVNLAAEVRPAGLVVESTFSSAKDMANSIFPVLSWLIYKRFDFNSVVRIRQVGCPVLVAHSPEDEIIPFRLGRKIYTAANPPKRFLTLQGDHNNGFLQSQPRYEQELGAFLATLTPAAGGN